MTWALGYMKEQDCIKYLRRAADALKSLGEYNMPGLFITKETVSKNNEPSELCKEQKLFIRSEFEYLLIFKAAGFQVLGKPKRQVYGGIKHDCMMFAVRA